MRRKEGDETKIKAKKKSGLRHHETCRKKIYQKKGLKRRDYPKRDRKGKMRFLQKLQSPEGESRTYRGNGGVGGPKNAQLTGG